MKKKKEKSYGDFDITTMSYLIYYSEKEYIIYIDNELDIDWETTNEFDEKKIDYSQQIQNVLNEVAKIESKNIRDWPKKIKFGIKRMLGEAIARAFNFQFDSAVDIISDARNFYNIKRIEISRMWMLSSQSIFALLSIIAITIILINSDVINNFLGIEITIPLMSFLSGIIGVFFFYSTRIGEIFLNSEGIKYMFYIESIGRSLSGGVSGLFVFVLLKSGLLLSTFLSNEQASPYVMILLAFIAGASERFIPDIVTKVEKIVNNDKGEKIE